MNQIPTAAAAAAKQPQQNLVNLPLTTTTPGDSPAVSLTSSPAKTSNVTIEPLTNVHVALESVQPGTKWCNKLNVF